MPKPKRDYTTYPIGPLSFARTKRAVREALLEAAGAGRIYQKDVPFNERWEWLDDAENSKDVFYSLYAGRSPGTSSVWRSEVGQPFESWTIPLWDPTGEEEAPWDNMINLVNSKDGVTVDQLYIQPRVSYGAALMRFDALIPNPASFITTPTSLHVIVIGFETNSWISHGTASFNIASPAVGAPPNIYINLNYVSTDGVIVQLFSNVTILNPGVHSMYWLDWSGSVLRFWQLNPAGVPIVTNTITATNPFPRDYTLIPFACNESRTVVSGFKLGYWYIIPKASDVPLPVTAPIGVPMNVDVSDRAARLLGVIYGDVGQVHQSAARSTFTMEESPTAIVEGQVTLTGAAQQFPADACKSITIENPAANAVVAVGHDNAVTLLNGYRLQPGAAVSMDIDNANRVWVIGTLNQIVSYLGVN